MIASILWPALWRDGVPVVAQAAWYRRGLSRCGEVWRLWRRRVAEREQIARFTDRDLRDAGLTRGDVYRELAVPFWQAK
jgi:uncharacterized protein YjiS (DUF1127 family)